MLNELSHIDKFIWAKSEPHKSLLTHLRETAITTKVLLQETGMRAIVGWASKDLNLSEVEFIQLCMYISGMHDIGKCHPLFACNPSDINARVFFDCHPEYKYDVQISDYRHELGSEDIAFRIWKNVVFDRKVSRNFAAILALHHQVRKGTLSHFNNWDNTVIRDEWIAWQDAYERYMRDWLQPIYLDSGNISHVDAVCTLMLAIVILSDWIASGNCLENTTGEETDIELATKIKTFIDSVGLTQHGIVPHYSFHDMWPFLRSDNLRPVQRTLETYFHNLSEMPLLIVLEAPMGEGKTEAGMFSAMNMAHYWGKSGLYFGLPTSATANQMVGRVNEIYGDSIDVRLRHGMSWLIQEGKINIDGSDEYNEASKWLLSSKRSMLTTVAVGTVDQAMLSVLRIKYGVLRLLGLEEKVLIIDEIHAYDAYMSDILKRLLEWCRELSIPVVLLSATLPSAKKNQYLSVYSGKEYLKESNYPQITTAFQDGRIEQIRVPGSYKRMCVRIELLNILLSEEEIARTALEKSKDGGCICVLVNTIQRAQTVFKLLNELCEDEGSLRLFLFHARFTAKRRQEIESECLRLFGPDHESRPKRAILVATQVVEQSLDIDFDAMITDIAPIDLLLQRAGRLHRHADTCRPIALTEPVLTVLLPKDENYQAAEYVYYKILLSRTAEVLHRKHMVEIPGDIPTLVETVYSDSIDIKDQESFYEKLFEEQLQVGEAKQCELKTPALQRFGLKNEDVFYKEEDSWVSAKTRLGDDSVRMAVIPGKLFLKLQERSGRKLRSAYNFEKLVMHYVVSVRKKWIAPFLSDNEGDVLEGTGKLSGIYFFRANEENAAPEESMSYSKGRNSIVVDKDLGVLLKGVTNNEI